MVDRAFARGVVAYVLALLLIFLAFNVATIVTTTPSNGQPIDRGAWFKSLAQPDTGLSCCDISDCHPTKSEYRGNTWWAEIAGKMVEVPANKVLPKASIFEDAVVCNSDPTGFADGSRRSPPTIYCFVPPPMGF